MNSRSKDVSDNFDGSEDISPEASEISLHIRLESTSILNGIKKIYDAPASKTSFRNNGLLKEVHIKNNGEGRIIDDFIFSSIPIVSISLRKISQTTASGLKSNMASSNLFPFLLTDIESIPFDFNEAESWLQKSLLSSHIITFFAFPLEDLR